ncbi:solute carrier family 23 member 3 isoform X3 [Oncorhynchus keta]|uniref:solute carrier family 23 member 3 isoform X3 n=1 Tax=Oncorhynchus keta TaxID=8018 RepID=UPI00227BCE46|nr:solute carrier family 23 member 3 isoform X3 [Oncorhynchus keta]
MIMDTGQRFDTELPDETRSTSNTDISSVNQHPPCFLNLLLAIQQVFVQCSLLVLVLGVLQQHLLLQDGERERLLSSMLFYSALSTLIQSCLGTCLPLVQAPSLEILIPAVVLTAQIVTEPACRGHCEESEEDILPRANPVRELQGMTVIVGMIQLLLGVTGLSGVVLRHCGPLVIAPLLCLLGFSIYREAALLCSDHWAIAALTVILLVLLSQHLRSYMLPACLSMPQLPVCRMLSSGSRWTVQLAAILGLALGVSPRLTQIITSVPLAIYGALLSVTYTIAVATGVRYFQFTHIDSGRNIFNIGLAVFMSLVLPHWFRMQTVFIDTGMVSVDVLLHSLLTSPVLLVGILAFLLDNTVSGSSSERGLDSAEMEKTGWTSVNSEPGYHQEVELIYESPYLLRRLWKLPWLRTAPFSACRITDDGDVL